MEIKSRKVSVVMAAYNEEPRIGDVLSVIKDHPLVGEIIVVDDGSIDKTAEIAKKHSVELIQNKHNLGKTLSVKKGIAAAKYDLIMMLDADLKGLDADGITKLIQPVIDGEVDWTLSLRGNSMSYMKLLKMDWVSGERVIPKRYFDDPLIWSRPEVGFGLETLLNQSLMNRGTSFCSVYLPNLKNSLKSEKRGYIRGKLKDLGMVREITTVMPLYKIIYQLFRMSNISRKCKANLVVKHGFHEA